MIRTNLGLIVFFCSCGAVAAERANEDDANAGADAVHHSANEAAASGSTSPFSVSPAVPRMANGVALAGYDGAASGMRARSAVDGRLLDFLAARVEYEHGPANGPNDRVSLGLRAKFLNQAAHGVELGAVVFYQPRDFRDEGNVVAGLLASRRFDRLTLVLNPLVGSDPEGDDQSLELRLGGLYRVGPWLVVGLDSRGRYNLSTDEKRAGHSTLDWEAQAGATACFSFGSFSFSTLLGPSLLQRTNLALDGSSEVRLLHGGLLAMAGAGASF